MGLAAIAAALAIAAGCDDERAPPARLVDGSPARALALTFEGVEGPVVATTLRQGSPPRYGCGPPARARTIVERVGVTGASITVAVDDGVHACDATDADSPCGQAFAPRPLPLRDPRLSLTCRSDGGDPIGFAWVVPMSGAAFVVVQNDGYAEAYPTAGQLPIRVTTSGVDSATSSAHVELTEHAKDGRLVRARSVDAQVAG
jgi:hypothetical protein